jgi:hypothetical protein
MSQPEHKGLLAPTKDSVFSELQQKIAPFADTPKDSIKNGHIGRKTGAKSI